MALLKVELWTTLLSDIFCLKVDTCGHFFLFGYRDQGLLMTLDRTIYSTYRFSLSY